MSNALDELKKTTVGLAVLADWLGDGLHPVAQEQADRRANSCLRGNDGKECTHLTHSKWWEKSKEAAAHVITKELEYKSKMNLKSEMDEFPRMCGKCGCCMPLKVFVPIKYVAANTSDEAIKTYPAFCWQRQEIENL